VTFDEKFLTFTLRVLLADVKQLCRLGRGR
jgi:hypothetical protein